MKNYVQKGHALEVTFGAAVSSGDGYLAGNLFGVVDHDVASGEVGTLCVEGVYELPTVPADSFAVGDLVYWDAGAGQVTSDPAAGANKLVGAALTAIGAVAGDIDVRLNGVTVS